MHFSFGISLLLVLYVTMQSTAFAKPIDNYALLTRYFPQLNATFAEHCYYDRAEWIDDKNSMCQLVSSQTTSESVFDILIEPLQRIYAEYVAHEPNDQQVVLECFMRNRLAGNASLCSTLVMSNQNYHGNKTSSRRELKSRAYVEKLGKYQSTIDYCLDVEAKMLPWPSTCNFLEELELVEHCFLFHQFTEYAPCENISFPRTALPNDPRSMYIYDAWANISIEYDQQYIEEFRMGIEGIPDPMAEVLECLHYRKWLENPASQCHEISSTIYKTNNQHILKLQELYANKKREDNVRDCNLHHRRDKFGPCFGVSWK